MEKDKKVIASHISKKDGFGKIEDVCMEVEAGEILALSGGNGSGKTLLLRTLSGLVAPDKGEVTICGLSMKAHPHHAKRFLGYSPEIHGYYDSMKVREYLEYYAAAMRLSGLVARKRIDYLLDMFDLIACANIFLERCSSGTKQRLSLARCLLNDPQVLLLDEPQNYLDPQGRALFKSLCLEYAEEGRTVIVCSHNLLQMDGICTSVGIMKNGCFAGKRSLSEIKEEGEKNNPLMITLADKRDVMRSVLLLRSLPLVERLTIEDCDISVTLSDRSADDRLILNELLKNSIATVSFGRKRVNLEEMFINLYQ